MTMSDEHNLPGVMSLIASAGTKQEGFKFLLNGDLNQMAIQRDFLREQGFSVGQVDVYPALQAQEEYDKAITLIWQRHIAGWWHYKLRLVELGVCTAEEFTQAFGPRRES